MIETVRMEHRCRKKYPNFGRRLITDRMLSQIPDGRWFDAVAVLEGHGLQLWLLVRIEEAFGVWMEQIITLRRGDVYCQKGIQRRNLSRLLWALRRWARGDEPETPDWFAGVQRRMQELVPVDACGLRRNRFDRADTK